MSISLVQKYLPDQCWYWLSKKTSYGTTIIDCCKSAFENPDTNVGLYAQDPECYDLFHEIFVPFICEYHKQDREKLESKHEFGNPEKLIDMPDDLQSQILSTRIRVGRTIKGFPMAGKLTKQQRLDLESKIKQALNKLSGEFSGKYKSVSEMSEEEKQSLINKHFLYGDSDNRFLESAGGYNDWPYGRGIFINKLENFLVWVNEEDHIRIISIEKGGALKQVYERLIKGVHMLDRLLEFEKHEKYGYLTFCPTNVGTALRVSVHIRIPKLVENEKLIDICKSLNLQPRGFYGENTEASDDGIHDISNKIRIGLTEWQIIDYMWNGVKEMLLIENNLSEETT